MLQIGEYQFLVLLLVVDAEFDQVKQRRRQGGIGKQAFHVRVHVAAVVAHFVERRARQQAALGAQMTRATAT